MFIAVATAVCTTTVYAQIDTVHLRLHSGFGKRGATYAYPIYCDDSLKTSDSVVAGQFTYVPNNVFTVVGIDTVGTLLNGKNVLFNAATKQIAFSVAEPITGKGVLFYLMIVVNMAAQPNVTEQFSLSIAKLNEGTPSVALQNGSYRPMDIYINPKNPPQNKIVGDSILFSVTGDLNLPVIWSVGDTSIASINSLGKFVGKKVGQTFVKVLDSFGLFDQSNIFPINSPSLNSLTMTIPDTSFMQNLTLDLPIRVSDVTSLGIISAQWKLNYNTNTLVPKGVFTTGTIAQSWGLPTVNYGLGTMDVAMAGPDTLTGKGVLAYIRFQVKRFATQNSNLDLQNVLFNESMTATVDNGIFSPIQGPVITVKPNVQVVTKGDTLTFTAQGGTSPYKWFVSDTSKAVIDSLTGKFKAKSKGIDTLIVFDAQGFDGIFTIKINDFFAALPDTSVRVGDSIDVPIYISDVTGLGILSSQIKISYDTTKVWFSNLISAGTISNAMIPAVKDSGSIISIALAGTNPLSGKGMFAKLRFHHKTFSTPGQVTPLTFVEYQNNEPSPAQPTATLKSGSILILPSLNTNPFFTNAMGDVTINEDQQLSFDYDAADADNDQIKFFLQNQPAGMTIDTMTGMLNWRPNFNQAGLYNFVVFAVDGKGGNASKQTNINVLNTNRPPQFISVLQDTIIYDTTKLSFKYSAIDLDNDIFSYSLMNSPPGASIDNNGNFNFKSFQNQTGLFYVYVQLNDGKSIVTDTAHILVLKSNSPLFFTKSLPDTTIKVNNQFSFQYSASSVNVSDTLIFGLFLGPQGLNVSPQGQLHWTPGNLQVGQHLVIVGVTNGSGGILDTAIITVQNSNQRPQFISTLPDINFPVDSTLNFKYSAIDPDNDNFIFSFVKFPAGAVILLDGSFSWKPSVSQIGKDTIVVAVSDGFLINLDTAIVTIFGFPRILISQNNFDFGSISFGGSKTLSTIITNSGTIPLTVSAFPEFNLHPDPSFILDTAGISPIAPGVQKTVSITYQPKSVGGQFTAFVFLTNDPKNQSIVLTANGSAIAKLAVTKKLLVDTLHNSFLSLTDSTSGVSRLFNFFEQSGIQITVTGSDLRPFGNDILLLVNPQKKFTRQEIDSVKTFVLNGGLLVALGNSFMEGNNASALNSLLKDTSWTTNLSLDSNVVVDSSSFFSIPAAPLLTTFADAKHPYFTNVDTLVFFGSASVSVTGSAIPLITTSAKGRTIGLQNKIQPAVAGLIKIGSGKILLLGDADLWKVQSSNQSNGQQNDPNISSKDNLTFAINVFSVTEDYEVKLPSKTLNEQYQLVSIPFDLDNADVESVLKGLGEQSPLSWRLFGRYNPTTLKYLEFPNEKFTSFKRGEAYWLITRGTFGLSLGNSTIIPVQSYYPIRIGPGYSMVGNPFPYKVSWKNSLHDSTQNLIWKFDGGSFKAESLALDPFAGYFVKNLSSDSVTIYINPEDITGLGKSGNATAVYAEEEWRISIGASSGKSSDGENYAGVAKGAKNEFDSYDVAEPPPSPTDYVMVRFQNNSWIQQGGSYALDIRSVNNEGLFWDFDVVTSKVQARISLNLEQLGNIPNDFVIYIVDKMTERVMQIDDTYRYEFSMVKNESRRNFRLIAGKKEYIEKNTQGIPLIAVDYALMQNYPNPFNPSTQIRYTLGHSGNISLDIYNVLGQRVRSLVNTIQQIGTYELEWDGKDDAGNTVSTGVYFYKLSVISNGEKTFTETKKLMLLK